MNPFDYPTDLNRRVSEAAAAAPPEACRRLAVWAARQTRTWGAWEELLALAQGTVTGVVSEGDLAARCHAFQGAACAASISGLRNGASNAAAALAAYGAAYADPREGLCRAVRHAYLWHQMDRSAELEPFLERLSVRLGTLRRVG